MAARFREQEGHLATPFPSFSGRVAQLREINQAPSSPLLRSTGPRTGVVSALLSCPVCWHRNLVTPPFSASC